ncbi:hypothetical protein [Nocardioides daphniae]|uniref:Uncharacterized protein n=1 Tax=Nocardioides daphniae TaxID=402297 RepID=A0A4P7UGK2_9ACTN|nr:hypothetical protein [Nocardioides daphniae]QCC78368.1 hypothetical protein E2C04_16305 [Nocardioides daphniae]GGD13136.1 hypothetical protein GCM10007231_10200 [Nocardioides daphniae]
MTGAGTAARVAMRALGAGLGGFLAGWVFVPCLLLVGFARSGFGTSDSLLNVAAYVGLSAVWPVATVAFGWWLERLGTALVGFAVGVGVAVVVLGIFA